MVWSNWTWDRTRCLGLFIPDGNQTGSQSWSIPSKYWDPLAPQLINWSFRRAWSIPSFTCPSYKNFTQISFMFVELPHEGTPPFLKNSSNGPAFRQTLLPRRTSTWYMLVFRRPLLVVKQVLPTDRVGEDSCISWCVFVCRESHLWMKQSLNGVVSNEVHQSVAKPCIRSEANGLFHDENRLNNLISFASTVRLPPLNCPWIHDFSGSGSHAAAIIQ
jgi:hypothetical protein